MGVCVYIHRHLCIFVGHKKREENISTKLLKLITLYTRKELGEGNYTFFSCLYHHTDDNLPALFV